MAGAYQLDDDLRLAVEFCMPTDSLNSCVSAMNQILFDQELTSLRELLNQKKAVKEVSIRRTNPYPHICLRMLFQVAKLAIGLRERHASSEVVEFGMRLFIARSDGNKLDPMEKLDEILEAARRAEIDATDVQLRRRNLGRVLDSGLGRSTWLQETPRQTVTDTTRNTLIDGMEEDSFGLRTSAEAGAGSSGDEGGTSDGSTPNHSDESSAEGSNSESDANGEATASGSNADNEITSF